LTIGFFYFSQSLAAYLHLADSGRSGKVGLHNPLAWVTGFTLFLFPLPKKNLLFYWQAKQAS
jgi:hypothetical protein